MGGQRVPKDSLRLEAYGTVDELNSFVGMARQSCLESGITRLSDILHRVQHELFNAGSILATLPDDVHPKQARIMPEDAAQLEREMDLMNEDLAPLRSFVLPGGSRNRLSDAFFVWSRWASHQTQTAEVLWEPNLAASRLTHSS